jgi:hypothetical protein
MEQLPFIGHVIESFLAEVSATRRIAVAVPGIGKLFRSALLQRDRPEGFSPGRLSKPGSLEAHLLHAGFVDVRRHTQVFPLHFDCPDAYLRATFEGTSAKVMLESLDASARERVVDRVLSLIRQDVREGRVVFLNEACFVFGRRLV